MRKRFLAALLLFLAFELTAQPSEEDALALSRLYEDMAGNFTALLEDLGSASQPSEIAVLINGYVSNNDSLFNDVRIMSEPFAGEELSYRLERAIDSAQTALDRMPEIPPILEPYIGDPDVAAAWERFRALFFGEAGQ